jgi:HlyD family secretion protein
MKRSYVIGGLALGSVLIAGLLYFLISGNNQNVQYRLDKVTRGKIQMTVSATGTLSAVTTIQVGTQISGIVQKIFVDYNDRVKKNQIIAQIDPTLLQQSVREADARRQSAQASYAEAKRTLDRSKDLLSKDLEAQAEYDSTLTVFESDKAALTQAQAAYDSAVIGLNYSKIRSPVDGVVIARQVDIGQTVAASYQAPTLFSIANDLTKMQVLASVDESDIGNVRLGQDVEFSVDAYDDETFHGKVSQVRINPVVDQNVVNYIVVIDVPNEDQRLMPGMTATITFMVKKKNDVLKITNVALRFQPPPDLVELRRDSAAQAQPESLRRLMGGDRAVQAPILGGGSSVTGQAAGMDVQATQRRLAARGIGRVWVLDKNKKLEPIVVHVGISDGTFTEISSPKIIEGQEIVASAMEQK